MTVAHLFPVVLVIACSNRGDTDMRHHARPESTLSGLRPLRMRNCPSAVPGARTTSQPTADGVDLTITATDPSAKQRVLMLARLQSGQREPIQIVPPHSGLHSGPGAQGFCPILHAGTTVSFDEAPDGVIVHVRASSADQVAALQRATAARVRALAEPSS
jgi:hypothetical protein